MSRIGILGGTFNPIHKGHIMLCEYCRQELNLDKIILIPTYTPPHKSSDELADKHHRLAMCRLACSNLQGYEVSDIEISRRGKSYSYQTITSLKELYPNDTLYFIMGADMFLTLQSWKNPEIIFKNAQIITIPRDMSDSSLLLSHYSSVLRPMGAVAHILSKPVMQVSSTEIRQNIGNGKSVDNLIDKNIYDYITNNNLYRK